MANDKKRGAFINGGAALFAKAKKAVVDAVDVNRDGKLGLDDVGVMSDAVKAAFKDSSEKWMEKQEQIKKEKEYEKLRPLFTEDIEEPCFSFPKLIRITEMDDKHAESSICFDSVGYIFPGKELDITTFYPDKIKDFGLRFYPDMESELYYVNPTDRDSYIALEEYFHYLKVARISELQQIAQDLGAKYFRVVYKEEKKSFSSVDIKAKAAGKEPGKHGQGEINHNRNESVFSKTEIAANMECIGHAPKQPELVYFKNDPQINNLVNLRMSDNNEIKRQTYTLKLSNTSGLRMKDAMKIDAALSVMKIAGNTTFTSEVENEARRVFEYEIEF